MIDWYRSGEDVERRLPTLSTIPWPCLRDSTYWYLTEYPELMRMAVQRLEDRWEGRNEKRASFAPLLQSFFTGRLMQQKQRVRTQSAPTGTFRLLLRFWRKNCGNHHPV